MLLKISSYDMMGSNITKNNPGARERNLCFKGREWIHADDDTDSSSDMVGARWLLMVIFEIRRHAWE